MSLRLLSIPAALLIVARAHAADAPRAEYASPEELGGEGTPHQADLSLFGKFVHVGEDARPNGLRTIGTFGIRERTLVGRSLAWAGGLDLEIGGSSTGFTYGGTLFPIGLGTRFGRGGTLAVTAGAGGDRVNGSVPLAARFPVELAFAFSFGPIRPTLWVRPSWISGANERKDGSRLTSKIDELEAGLTLRLGGQHRYWAEMNAGRGVAVGVVYREFMGARAIGATLGLDFSGGQ